MFEYPLAASPPDGLRASRKLKVDGVMFRVELVTSEIQVDSAIVLRKSDSTSQSGNLKRPRSKDSSLTAFRASTASDQSVKIEQCS